MADYEGRKPEAATATEANAVAAPRAQRSRVYVDAPNGVFRGPVSLVEVPIASAGGGRALPHDVRASMERSFGADLSAIRIHEDARAEAAEAQAYTRGTDIHFAPGRFDPGSPSGIELLAHEIAHVLQQAEGRVGATGEHPHAGALNTDASLEREADEAGARAARGEQARVAPAALSAPTPIVQRKRVVPSAVERKTRAEIFGDGTPAKPGLGAFAFEVYMGDQADWFSEPSLTAADRAALWKVANLFARGLHVAASLDAVTVAELAAMPSFQPLDLYLSSFDLTSEVVHRKTAATSLAHALEINRAMQQLAFLPGPVQSVVIPETGLDFLMATHKIAELETYYRMFRPTLEQPGEWRHIQSLLAEGPVMRWAPLLGWVSELHMFPLPVRMALRLNIDDTSRSRPVLLVAVSTVDWNGAFLNDGTLTGIASPKHLGLIVQGRSLGDLGSQIARVAHDYGIGGKLSQVVLAGHGSETSLQLTSDRTNPHASGGHLDYDNRAGLDTTDPHNNGTEQLVDTILASLDPLTGNLVLNACLGNAGLLPDSSKLTGTTAQVEKQLQANAKAHPSNADYIRTRMVATGYFAKVTASNMSTSAPMLTLDSSDHATLEDPHDAAAKESRLAYFWFGVTPEEVVRAAIECCADPAIGIAMMAREVRVRVALLRACNDLVSTCIRVGLGLALTGDGLDVAKLVYAFPRVAMWNDPMQFSADVLAGTVQAAEAPIVFGAMTAAALHPSVLAHVHQAWMKYDPGHATQMMAMLSKSGLTVAEFARHLSRNLVDPHLATMLPITDQPTFGQLLLALTIADADATPPAPVRAFLRGALAGPTARRLVVTLLVHHLLPDSVDLVLQRIGLEDPPAGIELTDDADADLDGDGTNETFVKTAPRQASVVKDNAIVRARATSSAARVDTLAKGSVVGVAGTVRDGTWSMIDLDGRVGFVATSDLSKG